PGRSPSRPTDRRRPLRLPTAGSPFLGRSVAEAWYECGRGTESQAHACAATERLTRGPSWWCDRPWCRAICVGLPGADRPAPCCRSVLASAQAEHHGPGLPLACRERVEPRAKGSASTLGRDGRHGNARLPGCEWDARPVVP